LKAPVKEIARWSRDMMAKLVEEVGPEAIVRHDEALARDIDHLKAHGAPRASRAALAGLLLAVDLVIETDDIDPVSARHVRQRLMLHAGLVAEAIENRKVNRIFEELVAEDPSLLDGEERAA
jgi:hypothetical protein